MNKNILILGKGFIGLRLKQEFNCQISGARINSFGDAQKLIKARKPKILINCIGHTGRNVDECELDKEKTLLSNTFVPIMLAEACLRNNVKLVHISSGCIYHYDYKKDKPLTEDIEPDFLDLFYSRSKIYSEQALNILVKKYPILIIRIRIPLDNRPHPKSILTKLVQYKTVIDLPNSVTYIPDFVRALKYLINRNSEGIYNVVNKGGLRYPELLKVYKKYNPQFQYQVIENKKLNLVRTGIILSTKKLEKTGFKVRNIHEVLEECVKGYLKL